MVPQQPDPNAPPESIILTGWDGLKNTVSRERLGPRDLDCAVNLDLDDAKQPHRRRGYTQKIAGNVHSLYTTWDGTVLGVVNGELGFINPDYSTQSLDAAAGYNPVCYCDVGSLTYYSGSINSGIIDTVKRTRSAWGSTPDVFLSPVVNPTATLPAIRGRLLGKPPLATSLTYYNGRIFLAQDKVLWGTVPFTYNFVDKTKDYVYFEQPITMVGTVGDGIYVGTTEGLWFLAGAMSSGMKRIRTIDSGVIPGTMVYIPAELGNPPQTGLDADTPLQVSIAFMTHNGWCVAEDSGQAYNMTETKMVFPGAVRGAGLFRRQDGMNTYLATLNSEGQPSNSARIGAYVSAEIVRAGSWLTLSDSVSIHNSFVADVIPGG